MKTKQFAILSLIVIALTILTACGGARLNASEPEEYPAQEVFVESGRSEPAAPANDSGFVGVPSVGGEAEKSGPMPIPTAGIIYQTLPDANNAPGQSAFANRLIIKNAEVSILVEDSDVAIDRLTQVVGDVGGYIVSSRVWYQPHADGENYKYASITLGIPVEQFEVTMRRVRGLALRVTDENASGEDVTDQYVDMESRLKNLEATQARIQSFLEDAKTVDEALRINQQLSEIEAQIEEVKGRMNYISDRAAFSTITVSISPDLPEIILPTPTPTATPAPWTPADTLDDATETLVKSYQGIVEFVIWLFVAVLPIIVPPALVIWFLVRLLRRKPNKPVSTDSEN